MKTRFIVLTLVLLGLAACQQAVPAERKNNCSCTWDTLPGLPKGERS
jgi:hypothetical protein